MLGLRKKIEKCHVHKGFAGLPDYPWIDDVPEDKSHLEIVDQVKGSEEKGILPIDILLSDGSLLSDKRNQKYYHLVFEYIELFKMFNPESTVSVFRDRVQALLKWIYWLKEKNVRRLEDVTRSHFDLYAKEALFGKEVVLGLPQKLHRAMQKALNKDELIMYGSPGALLIRRKEFYKNNSLDVIHRNGKGHVGPISKAMMDYYEIKLNKGVNKKEIAKVSYDELIEYLELYPQKVTEQTLQRQLLPLDELYQWSEYLESTKFKIKPYLNGSGRVASVLGIKSGRTPSIPAKLAFPFVQEATRWIIDCSDMILDVMVNDYDPEHLNALLKKHDIELTISEKSDNADSYVSKEHRNVNKLGLIRLLSTACFIVIGVLSARRKEEINELFADCYEDGWLRIYIEKTSQRMDAMPVPPLVGKAIEILKKLSSNARELYDVDSLFVCLNEENKLVEYKPDSYLNRFYEVTIKDKTGINWKFSPHQFRRFFALIYYHRFDDPALGILSFHLRHFSLDMTVRYITDDEFGKEMREVGDEWTASFLRDVLAGRRAVGGKAGNKIKKKMSDWAKEFSKKVDVVEREKVVNKMMKYMKRLGATFSQQVWGTICTCPNNTPYSTYAACKTTSDHPDYANADEGNYIPTYYEDYPSNVGLSGEFCRDDWYGCLASDFNEVRGYTVDYFPELYVGRLPAETLTEVNTFIDKLGLIPGFPIP